jgi:hypothetical protein
VAGGWATAAANRVPAVVGAARATVVGAVVGAVVVVGVVGVVDAGLGAVATEVTVADVTLAGGNARPAELRPAWEPTTKTVARIAIAEMTPTDDANLRVGVGSRPRSWVLPVKITRLTSKFRLVGRRAKGHSP